LVTALAFGAEENTTQCHESHHSRHSLAEEMTSLMDVIDTTSVNCWLSLAARGDSIAHSSLA